MKYESLIDTTRFAEVRRYLTGPFREPFDVLFVDSEELLSELALLLDGGNGSSQETRRIRWDSLLRSGQVAPSLLYSTFGVDLADIPDDARCRVIMMPLLYLVYLCEIELAEITVHAV